MRLLCEYSDGTSNSVLKMLKSMSSICLKWGGLTKPLLFWGKIVNDENFVSQHGKSKHQLWNELCELISKNPEEVHSLNVDAIIRGGLRRYTDQLGHLWNSLATYYVRSGLFDRARDIYEEAIQTVATVRDFTQVFDAYAQFEELTLSKKMEEVAKLPNPAEDDDIELELRLARFENLMERRLLLLNSVLLRQNPHNVQEWHKRVQLYEGVYRNTELL
jgi:pre-mRNA-splicing factor SYF1